MDLKAYFEKAQGTGVMSTADCEGRVDAAVYAKPYVMDDGTLAFIMRERLTHKNINENPYAVYLFIEHAPGYKGVRLFMKKVKEDQNPDLIEKMTRCWLTPEENASRGPKFMVYFTLEKALKLIGGETVDANPG